MSYHLQSSYLHLLLEFYCLCETELREEFHSTQKCCILKESVAKGMEIVVCWFATDSWSSGDKDIIVLFHCGRLDCVGDNHGGDT
jgi:hypothetical protein